MYKCIVFCHQKSYAYYWYQNSLSVKKFSAPVLLHIVIDCCWMKNWTACLSSWQYPKLNFLFFLFSLKTVYKRTKMKLFCFYLIIATLIKTQQMFVHLWDLIYPSLMAPFLHLVALKAYYIVMWGTWSLQKTAGVPLTIQLGCCMIIWYGL